MRSSPLIEHWRHFSALFECMKMNEPTKAIFLSLLIMAEDQSFLLPVVIDDTSEMTAS
jgi:hypothetical protein